MEGAVREAAAWEEAEKCGSSRRLEGLEQDQTADYTHLLAYSPHARPPAYPLSPPSQC